MRLEFIIILRRDILDNGVWLKIRKGAMRKKKKKSLVTKVLRGLTKKKKKIQVLEKNSEDGSKIMELDNNIGRSMNSSDEVLVEKKQKLSNPVKKAAVQSGLVLKEITKAEVPQRMDVEVIAKGK